MLLGHRGARHRRGLLPWKQDLPKENTLAAFEYALVHGCDGFEFDVRSTRDGRNILCHDPKLKAKVVVDTTFEQLTRHCAETLPCLEDVLEQFGNRAYLDIELKESGYEAAVLTTLKRHPPTTGFIVSSFRPGVLQQFHQLDPSIPLGYLCDRPQLLDLWRDLPLRVVLPRHSLVDKRLVDQVHAAGCQLFTWTVNGEAELLRLATYGVDGLISDDPVLLGRVFASPVGDLSKPPAKSD